MLTAKVIISKFYKVCDIALHYVIHLESLWACYEDIKAAKMLLECTVSQICQNICQGTCHFYLSTNKCEGI